MWSAFDMSFESLSLKHKGKRVYYTEYPAQPFTCVGGLWRTRYSGFARQPCCMAGTKDSFSHGKRSSFICKIFSLFLPCNMAAVQNLYITNSCYSYSMRCKWQGRVFWNLALINDTESAFFFLTEWGQSASGSCSDNYFVTRIVAECQHGFFPSCYQAKTSTLIGKLNEERYRIWRGLLINLRECLNSQYIEKRIQCLQFLGNKSDNRFLFKLCSLNICHMGNSILK